MKRGVIDGVSCANATVEPSGGAKMAAECCVVGTSPNRAQVLFPMINAGGDNKNAIGGIFGWSARLQEPESGDFVFSG